MNEDSPVEAQLNDVSLADEDAATLRPSRTHLLLSASIDANGVASRVRIRNLSERGALIEGAALPPVGSSLVLRRRHLEMAGQVVWADKSRCGVRFAGTIAVAGWREGNWIAPIGRRADAAGGKGAAGQDASVDGVVPQSRLELDARIAVEMVALQQQLSEMVVLSGETTELAEKNSALLRQLDIVAQALGILADVLKAEDRRSAIEAIEMEQLRSRLQGTVQEDGAARAG